MTVLLYGQNEGGEDHEKKTPEHIGSKELSLCGKILRTARDAVNKVKPRLQVHNFYLQRRHNISFWWMSSCQCKYKIAGVATQNFLTVANIRLTGQMCNGLRTLSHKSLQLFSILYQKEFPEYINS